MKGDANLIIELADGCERTFQSLSDEDKDELIEKTEYYGEFYMADRTEFFKNARQPVFFRLNDKFDSSLYYFRINDELRMIASVDEHGIINEACKILPDVYKVSFLEALGELEDNNSHKFKKFLKTRLHRVRGTKQIVYRADIDKTSGWRIHLQHIDGVLCT